MRIATWNLERPKRGSVARNEAVAAKLHNVNADLWVLTETNAAIALSADEYNYESIATPPVEGYHSHGENYTTIHSRWPIARTIETAIPELSVCAEINAPSGRLLVYGTIITYANDRGPDGASKRWVEHRAAIQRQGTDWLRLRRDYPDHTLIIAGDFNQSRDGSGWYEDRESLVALSNALDGAGLRCLTEQDFQALVGLSRHSIDHICITGDPSGYRAKVGVWEGKIDGRRLSDHNGVHVDIGA